MKTSLIAVLAVLALGFASPAFAQTAAPAAPAPAAAAAAPAGDAAASMAKKPMKPKKAAKGSGLPKTPVTIKNSSGLALVELSAMAPGLSEPAKILGALAADKSASAMVPHDKTCLVDLHGSFEDGSTVDASGVDVCKQKKLNLTPP